MVQPRETLITVPQPDPNEKLVKVFDTEQESEAIVVKGLLESAGIECNLTSISTVQDAFPGLGGVVILVREEDAEPARRILAEFKQPPGADDDETSEIEVATGEPLEKARGNVRQDKK
jgi:hypothetical protein